MDAEHSFGDWLRQRRQDLDLTREALARRVGCSTVTLRKLEAEERRPSKQMAERLAEVLQVAPDDRPAFLRFARGDPFAAPEESKRQRSHNGHRHNLPIELTSFIGREKEIEAVQRSVGSTRLVTLTGVGGAGKTRLALHVAVGLLDTSEFPDGVWLVELAHVADPALVPQTVAGVLGIKEQAGRPMLATLSDHLRDETVLLVMDNCEHLVAACAQFSAGLLQSCPNLRILATSREALGIHGETTFLVPPLSSPDQRHPLPLDALIHYEAVRLFVDRAGAALPGFSLTADNARAVARICRQLDGIPLAIELAAARVRVLQVEQIAARLGDRFRLLTGGSRAALPRQQTLQALIDWSYDLLAQPERVLLRRLAVFVGGWTLVTAEAACADQDEGGRPKDEEIQPSEVLELLSQLVNKSLVMVERQPRQEVRYRLLETIREYAQTKLVASGEADLVWRRLAGYFVERVKTFQLVDPSGGVLDDHGLVPEFDNLRAMLAWSQVAEGAQGLGLRLAGAVMGLWIERGYWNEARGLLEGALRRAQPAVDAPARARVLLELGTLAYFQGEYGVATAYLLDSLGLSRELKDRLAIGTTLTLLGEVALEQGDAVGALLRYQESLALFRELGSTEGIAWALNDLGEVAVMQEDVVQATALLEEALALSREVAKPHTIAWALNGLGHTAQLVGDLARAQQLHTESLEQYREYGEPNEFIPWAYLSLGQTALAQGDAALTRQHFLEALRLFRDEGDRGAISFCLAGLAGAAVLDEDPERAAQLWGAAEALRQSIGTRQAPASRATRERLMAAARERLGEEAFEAAWAEGRAMTMEQAVVVGLSVEKSG